MRSVFLVALIAGCSSQASSTGIDTVACPTASNLTYANFGAAFIHDNCGECHEGKESPSLKTQAQVAKNSSKILDETVYTDAMPEDGNLTIEERRMLGEWLACGAP